MEISTPCDDDQYKHVRHAYVCQDGDIQVLFVPWSCCEGYTGDTDKEPINGTTCQREAETGSMWRRQRLHTEVGC